jgi:SNF2 family DNA or RNA helicase
MYQEKTKSFQHQVAARGKSRRKRGFAFFMEMGTGKTKVDIDESCELYVDKEIDIWIIIAPKGVYSNWPDVEFPVHMPDPIRDAAVIGKWGAGANAARQLERLLKPSESFRILIINVEAFSAGGRATAYCEQLIKTARRGVKITVDESPTIKNVGSRRTREIVCLGKMAKYKRILTGSPVLNSPLDLYAQFAFLDEKLLGFSSYYSFRARYAILRKIDFGGRKVQVVVGFRETEDLSKKITPHSYRVLKSQCLDLPPKIYVQREVGLTDQQARMYKELLNNATTKIDELGPHVTATEVIVQITRLHQLVCGHIVDEEDNVHAIDNNRLSTLMEVLSETSEKAVIWSRYRFDLAKIVEAISKEYGETSIVQYHGGVSDDDRKTAINRFQADPTCRFFVGNAATAGRGLTLTAAGVVIYYSNDFSLDNRIQSEDRVHRQGLTKSVTYVDLVTPKTIDMKVLKALRNKINISSAIMGDGAKAWLI